MPLSNTSFDSRLVATIGAWVNNNLADMITGNNPLFFRMRERGNIRKGGGHGGQFVEPTMFPDGSGGAVTGVSNPYTALTFADTTNMTGAAYTVAEKILPISVTEYDLNAQGSDTEKVNLVQGVMDISVAKFNENLNGDLWAIEQTAGTNGSRTQLASIRTLLNGAGGTTTGGFTPPALAEQNNTAGAVRAVCSAASQTAVFTVGGINRNATGAAYWCTPIINTAQALSVQSLSGLVSLATRGADSPDLIVLHRDMFDKLMSLLTVGGTSGGQVFSGSKLAEAGFQAIKFRSCDVIFDDNCPATCFQSGAATQYGYNAFAINTKYLKLRATSLKPQIREYPDPRPIRTWTAYMNMQLTSGHLGRVHARHVNLS